MCEGNGNNRSHRERKCPQNFLSIESFSCKMQHHTVVRLTLKTNFQFPFTVYCYDAWRARAALERKFEFHAWVFNSKFSTRSPPDIHAVEIIEKKQWYYWCWLEKRQKSKNASIFFSRHILQKHSIKHRFWECFFGMQQMSSIKQQISFICVQIKLSFPTTTVKYPLCRAFGRNTFLLEQHVKFVIGQITNHFNI